MRDLPTELTLLDPAAHDLTDAEFASVSVDGANLVEAKATRLRFEDARIQKTDFSGCALRKLNAGNVDFEYCNISNGRIVESTLHRVGFANCKLTGVHFENGDLTDVEFAECRMDFAVFHSVRLRAVTFRDCDLRDVDFHDVQFDSVRFERCGLAGGSFSATRFSRSEFAECKNDGLRGVRNLRGASMSVEDAVSFALLFADELGIDVYSAGEAR